MKLTIQDKDLKELLLEHHFDYGFHSSQSIVEKTAKLKDDKIGEAIIRQTWFDGVHILKHNSKMNQDLAINFENKDSIYEMHFSLCGTAQVDSLNYNQRICFAAQQHNFFFSNQFEGTFKVGKQRENHEVVEIHFTEAYFNRFADVENKTIQNFLKQSGHSEMVNLLSPKNMPITPQMNLILFEIGNCQKTGMLKRMYLESKIIELLLLQIEQFEASQNTVATPNLRKEDIEKIYYAKELVEKNMSQPYSLLELSHKVGLNDFKLKKGFKQLFGTTVFGYLHEIRMQYSKRMLLDEHKSIPEIADYCGYQHVHHFTTAFKNKFGYTPAKLKFQL